MRLRALFIFVILLSMLPHLTQMKTTPYGHYDNKHNTKNSTYMSTTLYGRNDMENLVSKNKYDDRRFVMRESSGVWHVPELKYRIPITIHNDLDKYIYMWPIKVFLNFTGVAPKPYNQTLVLVDDAGRNILFQVDNYKILANGSIEYFDIWFYYNASQGSETTYYLYFSDTYLDVSSYWYTDRIYTKIFDISSTLYTGGGILDSMGVMNRGGIAYNFSFGTKVRNVDSQHSPNYKDPNDVAIIWVENPYVRYEILVDNMSQNYNPKVNDSITWKVGIFNVTYGNLADPKQPFLSSEIEVRYNATSRLTDMEDSLNGPYRLETHILFISLDGINFNATAPDLSRSKIIGEFGPMFCRISFINASILDFYVENTTPINYTAKYNILESITYTFFSRQNWYHKEISIYNGYIREIQIYDRDPNHGSLTQAIYSWKYNRFNVSPSEGGSMFQFFSWYDDLGQPPQISGNEYISKGNAMGLPYGYGTQNINSFECAYMYWTPNSLGREGQAEAIAYIIETKEYMMNATAYTKQGSYFINANISTDIEYLYDGMFGTIGLDLVSPIIVRKTTRFSAIMGADNYLYLNEILSIINPESATIDFNEYARYLTEIFYYAPQYLELGGIPQKIQSRDNSLYVWAYKVVPADGGVVAYLNITANITILHDQMEIPYFDVMILSSGKQEYTVYVYKPIVYGTYNITLSAQTAFGDVVYIVTRVVTSADLQRGNISIEMPICDYLFAIKYDPSVSSKPFEFPGYVNLTLINSSYINITNAALKKDFRLGEVVFRDLPYGNYSVYFNITQKVMGADIDEQKDLTIDWGTNCYIETIADLGRLKARVIDRNNNPVAPAEIYVDNAGFHSSIVKTGPDGYAEIIGIPLYNRTGNYYVINVSYFSENFNVTVYNSTVSYQHSSYVVSFNITLQMHSLSVHVITYDGREISTFKIGYKHANMNWTYDYSRSPIYIFQQVPARDYIPSIELNISMWLDTWGLEVYNYTIIPGLDGNRIVDIQIPMYALARIDIYKYYYGMDIHIDNIYRVDITLEATNVSYTFYSIIGFIEVREAPFGYNFTLNVTIETKYYFYIFNETTIVIDKASLDLRMFYLADIIIYAYPEYNESMKLADFSFAILANQTPVGTIFAGERGDAVLDEFPIPSLYGLTPFKINASGSVRGVDIQSSIVIDLPGVQDSFTIGIPQKLSELTVYIYDTENMPISADLDLVYLSAATPITILKERIDGGRATFDVVPQGYYQIRFRHFSIWGIVIVDSFEGNITEPLQELSFVLSVSSYTVETRNLIGDPLDGVFVRLYIGASGEILDFNIIGVSSSGSILFDDMPAKDAIILVNESRLRLDNITAEASYKMSTLEIYNATLLSLADRITKLYMPLGVAEIYFSYQGLEGPKNVTIEEGILHVDPKKLGPPIISIELLNVGSALLYNVPVGYGVTLVCEYQTPYGLPSATKMDIVFNDSYTKYMMTLSLTDLRVYAVGHDETPLQNATVSLIISATTIYARTNFLGYADFYKLPSSELASLQISLVGAMETITSDYIEIMTGVDRTVIVNVDVIDLTIGVRNIEGELLNNIILDLEKELTILSLVPNESGFIDVGLVAYGEYRVTIYILEDNATLPSNFSNTYLMISSETPKVMYLTVDLGEIIYSIDAPESGYQNSEIEIVVRIADVEGRAISGLRIVANIIDRSKNVYASYEAEEVGLGIYAIRILTKGFRHGYYTFAICIETIDWEIMLETIQIYIHSAIPRITLGAQDYMYLALGVLLFTALVSIVYHRLMKQMRVSMQKGIGRLEKIYGFLLLINMGLILLSGVLPVEYGYFFFDSATNILILIAALVLSIVLYGVLIYIDAVKSFLAARFKRSRLVLNAVMYLLPLITLKYILDQCRYIEWTQEYVLENLASWGPIVAPALAISFMTAYITVYTALIINSYRDIRTTARKIAVFQQEGVPEDIIRREMRLQLRRISGGIRIKMLVFLGLLGLSAFSTVPIFQSVAFIIVAIPIALLIIGPYIAQVMINIMLGKTEY